jgi:5-methylcytosine-specific restriction endonuclease McrA
MGRPFLPRPKCIICGKTCNKRESIFCSRECHAQYNKGKPRPYMLGNQYSFRGEQATTWAQYKRMQRLCSEGPCTVCGSTDNSVIHHKDHNPHNTISENLTRMCRACHLEEHRHEIRQSYKEKVLRRTHENISI